MRKTSKKIADGEWCQERVGKIIFRDIEIDKYYEGAVLKRVK